jgi:hypothetical protein
MRTRASSPTRRYWITGNQTNSNARKERRMKNTPKRTNSHGLCGMSCWYQKPVHCVRVCTLKCIWQVVIITLSKLKVVNCIGKWGTFVWVLLFTWGIRELALYSFILHSTETRSAWIQYLAVGWNKALSLPYWRLSCGWPWTLQSSGMLRRGYSSSLKLLWISTRLHEVPSRDTGLRLLARGSAYTSAAGTGSSLLPCFSTGPCSERTH